MRTGYLACRWYARRNDLIGGWCVMPVDEPPSQGVPEVADFTSHELAEHIAGAAQRVAGLAGGTRNRDMKTANLGMFTVQPADFRGRIDIRCTACGQAGEPAECLTLADLIGWYWQHACAPLHVT